MRIRSATRAHTIQFRHEEGRHTHSRTQVRIQTTRNRQNCHTLTLFFNPQCVESALDQVCLERKREGEIADNTGKSASKEGAHKGGEEKDEQGTRPRGGGDDHDDGDRFTTFRPGVFGKDSRAPSPRLLTSTTTGTWATTSNQRLRLTPTGRRQPR